MSRESQPRLASDPGARAAIPFFLTTEYTEHTEKNRRTVMPCFRVFGVFRGSLLSDNGCVLPVDRLTNPSPHK